MRNSFKRSKKQEWLVSGALTAICVVYSNIDNGKNSVIEILVIGFMTILILIF